MGGRVLFNGVVGVYLHAGGRVHATSTACFLVFFFSYLSVERSQGIVLLDMSSLCLFFLFFLFFFLWGFQARGLRAVY